jgi:hypothetical protein
LDVLHIDAALLDLQLVEALAVPAGALPPVGDGALVEAVGGDDGLAGTAVAEQGQSEGDPVKGLVQAVVRGVRGGGEGLATGGATEAVLLAGGDADVAQTGLAPVQAVEARAEWRVRPHR